MEGPLQARGEHLQVRHNETSLDEAKEKELCVCDVPTAAMADQIKEKYGDETMAIFVGPATIENTSAGFAVLHPRD